MKEIDLPQNWKTPITVIGLGVLTLTILVAVSGRLAGATNSSAQLGSGTPAVVGSLDSGQTPAADGGFRASVLSPIQTMIAQFRPTPAAASKFTVWMGVFLGGRSADSPQPAQTPTPNPSTGIIPGATPTAGAVPPNVPPAAATPPPAFTPGPPAGFPGGDDDEGHGGDHYKGGEYEDHGEDHYEGDD